MRLIDVILPFSYSHRISDRPGLVDKSCCTNHTHDPAFLAIGIQVTKEFLDFKTAKNLIIDVIRQYDQMNITDKYQIETTEDFMDRLVKEIKDKFPNRHVRVHLQETTKYGMTDVSD